MNNSDNLKSNSYKNVFVCFISNISKQVRDYLTEKLKSLNNVQIIFRRDKSLKELLKVVPKADILIGWRPSKKILKSAKNVQLFINPGAGVQHLIDLFRELNRERKVLLINGHGNSYFVAQHAVALLMTLMNKIVPHHEWMRQGKWRTGDKDAESIPLRFRKIGLLGYGSINQKVHRFLSGFDVEFSVLRKHWEKQTSLLPTRIKKYKLSQLHDFLENIDTLIVAVPLTSLTIKMIKRDELELLGPSGLIVNISRGDIIDEKSLYNALKDKVIQGAAIDVWYNYSPEKNEQGKKFPFNFPFHSLENIILSPHRGYSPFNDLLRWDEVIENVTRMARGRQDFINVVDLEEEY
ncbi:MAG: NAD(P)-dependent oxidoreductase [Candidatus Hodarchaeota archaeon]